MCPKRISYALSSILMMVALFVTFATLGTLPPIPDPPPRPKFKSSKAMIGMTPFTLRLAVSVGACSNEIIVTASQNGRHRRDSQHYRKRALDFRTRHLTKKERTQFEGCAKAVLGDSYFVKLSSRPPHLHVALLAEPQ